MRLFKRKEENFDIVNDVLLRSLLKGDTISKEQALEIPALSSAVDRISQTVAMIPIKLYRKIIDKDTNKVRVEEVRGDPRIRLLNIESGDTLDAFQMKREWVKDYLLDKGGFLFIEKRKNEFKSLRYVECSKISSLKNYDPIFKDITFNIEGKIYEPFNFLKIIRNSKDGGMGKTIISEVNTLLQNSYQTLLFELGLIKTGGAKKGFITSQRRLGENEINLLKKAWSNLYSNKSDNAIVLNEGMDFKEGSSTTVELQLNERKKTFQEEINNLFHNKDDFNDFIKEAIMPILIQIKTALNKDLLLESEKEDLYFEFDTREITKANIKERYEAYKIAVDAGWISKNEIRYLEDYDSIDGLDVITLSLANVVYDINTKKYYTPNTKELIGLSKGGEKSEINST